MKKIVATIVLCIGLYFYTNSQTWLNPHTQINLPNVPAKAKLNELISSNGSNALGQTSLPNAGTIKTLRNFHLMENDAKYNFFPSEGILNADTCSCANVWCNGGGCNDIVQAGGTKSGFESYKGFYCAWKTPAFGFTEIYSATESIFPKANFTCTSNSTINRGYPNKWYSLTEFGGINNIAQNYKNYVISYLKTFCPKELNKPALTTVLEIGNEPWGDPYPGTAGYHELLRGAVAACREYYGSNDPKNWRIQLSLAAFRAHNSGPGPFGEVNYYVENVIPDSLKPYYMYAPIHPYAFNITNFNAGNISAGVSETPESDDGAFLTFKNMIDWKNQKMPHAKVNIGEFGWDAEIPSNCPNGAAPMGESSQAAYTMRAYMHSARYDIHRSFVYGFTDQYECPLYYTTGLFKDLQNNVQRKMYKCIQTTVASTVGDKRFLKALTENTNQANNGQNGAFVYIFGDAVGTPTHIVAWRPIKLTYEDNNYPALASNYTTITLPGVNLNVNVGAAYYYMGWDNSQNGTITNNGTGTVDITGTGTNVLNVKLSGMPIVIPISANGCKYDSLGVLTCPSGISNIKPESILNMYYSNDNSMMYINTGDYKGDVHIKIYDMQGRKVYNSSYIAAGTHSFEFKGSTLGIYMVEVLLADGTSSIKKIVTK